MLKPHIDIIDPNENAWRGSIQNNNQSWFDSYNDMIVKYAKLAEKLKMEMLSIECELVNQNSFDE